MSDHVVGAHTDLHSDQGGRLRQGDTIEGAVATDDGAIDLGAQRTVVTCR